MRSLFLVLVLCTFSRVAWANSHGLNNSPAASCFEITTEYPVCLLLTNKKNGKQKTVETGVKLKVKKANGHVIKGEFRISHGIALVGESAVDFNEVNKLKVIKRSRQYCNGACIGVTSALGGITLFFVVAAATTEEAWAALGNAIGAFFFGAATVVSAIPTTIMVSAMPVYRTEKWDFSLDQSTMSL